MYRAVYRCSVEFSWRRPLREELAVYVRASNFRCVSRVNSKVLGGSKQEDALSALAKIAMLRDNSKKATVWWQHFSVRRDDQSHYMKSIDSWKSDEHGRKHCFEYICKPSQGRQSRCCESFMCSRPTKLHTLLKVPLRCSQNAIDGERLLPGHLARPVSFNLSP